MNINVTWDSANSKPSAPDVTVRGNANSSQTITWTAVGVDISAITTPSDGNASHTDFTAPQPTGSSGNWQCTDNLVNTGDFSYTITATKAGGGPERSHDPQITNGRPTP